MRKRNIFLITVGAVFVLSAWVYLGWFMFCDFKNDQNKQSGNPIAQEVANKEQILEKMEEIKTNEHSEEKNNLEKNESDEVEEKSEKDRLDNVENKKIKKEEKKDEKVDKEKNEEKAKEENKTLSIKKILVTWGYSTSGRKAIDTIVVHSVYNSLGGEQYNINKILDIFKSYNVSAHYVIDREGTVYQLVDEKHVSWHAGNSKMPDGRADVNSFSIGIELVNAENDQPTATQYAVLSSLIKQIEGRHNIKYILGHNDIASGRKTDPWNFEWSRIGGKKK